MAVAFQSVPSSVFSHFQDSVSLRITFQLLWYVIDVCGKKRKSQNGGLLIKKFNQTTKWHGSLMIQDTPNTLCTVHIPVVIVQYLNLWRHCLLTSGSECRHISPIVVLPQVNLPLIMLPLSHVKNAIKLEINNEDGDNIMKREQPKSWIGISSVSKSPNRKFSYDQNKFAVTERVWPLSGYFWLNIFIIVTIIFCFCHVCCDNAGCPDIEIPNKGLILFRFPCSSQLVLIDIYSFYHLHIHDQNDHHDHHHHFFPWPSSRSCLTTGRVLLPEWVDRIARPHLAPLASSWAQWFSSRDYIWTALIFQTVSLFVEFSSFLPHLHNKKISVVGHRRDSNVDLFSAHRRQSRLWVLAVEVLRHDNREQHQLLLLVYYLDLWRHHSTRQSYVGKYEARMKLICIKNAFYSSGRRKISERKCF